ncbi:MAG: putative nucleic acid-binding protein [Rhodothermales bacterium]|jgi:predicted nucleic acid-binding protein
MSCFVDTNVLVYWAKDPDPERRDRARSVVEAAASGGHASISVQVMSEFARVCLSKSPNVDPGLVRRYLNQFDSLFRVFPLSYDIVLEAIRGVTDHQFSYFDAQIWAAARLHQIETVLSEDFSDGRTIEGVRFLNPFAAGFDLDQLRG